MIIRNFTFILLFYLLGLLRTAADETPPLTITPVCNPNIVSDYGELDLWFAVQNNTEQEIAKLSYTFTFACSGKTIEKSGVLTNLKIRSRKSFNFFYRPETNMLLPGRLDLTVSWNKITFTRSVSILRPFSDLSGYTMKSGRLLSPEGNRAIMLAPHFDWKKKRSWQLLRWSHRKLTTTAIKQDICFIAPRLTNKPKDKSYLDIIRDSLGGVNFKTITPKTGEISLMGSYIRSQISINTPSFRTFFIMPNPKIYSSRYSVRKLYHSMSLLIQHIQKTRGRRIYLISPPPHSSAMTIAEEYKNVFDKISREFEVDLIDILSDFSTDSALDQYYRDSKHKDPVFYTHPVIKGHQSIAEIILRKTHPLGKR